MLASESFPSKEINWRRDETRGRRERERAIDDVAVRLQVSSWLGIVAYYTIYSKHCPNREVCCTFFFRQAGGRRAFDSGMSRHTAERRQGPPDSHSETAEPICSVRLRNRIADDFDSTSRT